MPRKKKEETEEEKKEEVVEAKEEKTEKKKTIEKKEKEKEEKEEKDKKEEKAEKKDKKEKLSEKELKKVMTDTKETLVPLTDYIRCSTHLGTKVITPDMRRYVYKRRADGLAVINTKLIDDKLREGIAFFKEYAPEDVFIACKREAGWIPVEKFSEVTGIRAFTKKYPSGIITNTELDDFFETKLVIICDPWVDKNALNDAVRVKVPVLGLCDTNNYTKDITQKVIGNNKSQKSIGLVLFVLAREYLKTIGKEKEAKELDLEDFTGKLEEVELK